ncbi:MAG: type II secretion system protein [Pseudomonadota bacterium]
MKSTHGFSLMEMIAVMAIIAILAAVLAPNLIDSIDRADVAAERQNLVQLADDLERYISRTGIVPSSNSGVWSAAIASVGKRPSNDVLRNRREHARFVYFDPNFLFASGGFSGYTQSSGLANAPASPRFMIISNIKGDIPAQASDAARFENIWSQNASAAIVESSDIIIERRHLGGHFHRVLLSNADTAQAGYTINGVGPYAVPAASGSTDGFVSAYIIDGSEVAVYAGPYPTGALQTAVLVKGYVGMSYDPVGAGHTWVKQ